MSKKKNLKAEKEREHFFRRIKERYDIALEDRTYQQVISTIKGKHHDHIQAIFLQRVSHTRSIYEITISNKTFVAVYDNSRHQLVTALPEEN